MASKTVNIRVNFDSNGKQVFGALRISAEDMRQAVETIQKTTQKSMTSIMNSFAGVNTTLSGLATGVSALAADFNSFDKAMRAANTMAGKSAAEFESLKSQIKDLSKEIPMARDELANGLYQVISNGVPEDNWIAFLAASAKSAVGGMADINEVVKVTSTVIKNYGYSWEEAADIQDKIQLTAKNGVTSFEQLAQALPRVTGNAATLGVGINELLATFSTLTGVSGNTAEVSTQLAAVFTALVKPSSEARKMAAAMGIEFNAASIKAAGGLEQFLSSLDTSVKQYAQANGILEKEVYGKLFGSAESLRALGPLTGQLATTFRKNVALMADSAGTMDVAFNDMASTGESAAQILKNKMADLTDSIGRFAGTILPTVQFTAYFGQALAGLTAVSRGVATAFTALTGVVGRYNVVQKVNIALSKSCHALLAIMPKSVRQFSASLTILSTTSRAAAVAINVLKYAIKGLMISTVIGLAIAAVTSIIEAFMTKAAKAADSVDDLTDEFEQWKKSLGDVSRNAAEVANREMTVLNRLYQTATDETKSRLDRLRAVEELQKKYPQYFGNLSKETIMAGKAKEAYDNLTESIIKASRARAAQNRLDEYNKEKLVVEDQLETARQNRGDAWNEKREANMAYDNFTREEKKRREQTHGAMPEDGAVTFQPDLRTERQLEERVEAAEKNYTAAVEAVKTLEERNNELDAEINRLAGKVKGADYSVLTTEADPDYMFTLTPEVDKDTDKANKELTERNRLEKELAEAKEKYMQATLNGNYMEATSQQMVIAGLKQQLQQLDLIELRANRPGLLKSLQDIDDEIAYQRALRETASAAEIAGIDREIEALERKRDAFENTGKPKKASTTPKATNPHTSRLATMSDEVNSLNSLSGHDYTVEVRAIGFDQLKKNIRELQRMLADTENPLDDSMREQAEGVMRSYADMQKVCANSFDTFKEGIGATMGIGNSITSMVDTMQSGNTVWEKANGLVNGAISLYESFQSILGIINMLTAANVATKQQDVAVTGEQIVAETAEQGVKVADTAVTTVDTTANIENAASKVMAAHASIPFAGIAIAGGLVATMIALMAGLPKFAEGGIAYGPTVGLFGEYAGASNNPEVVAPLNKLRSLIEPQGGYGKVEFEIDGRKLKGVLRKVDNLDRRS